LKARTAALEKNRGDKDRPDIDDLQSSRTHLYWEYGGITFFLTIVGGALWCFRNILWNDSIKPRLRKAVLESEAKP
jgi:hypothetical protein